MRKKQNTKFTNRKLVIILICLLAAVVSAAVILNKCNRKDPGLPGTMPAEPVLTNPADNGTVYLGSGGRLMWVYDPVAVSWDVEVSENPDMTNPVVKQNVVLNYFPLPQDVLRDGETLYWRVIAKGGANGGTTPVVSATRNFTVVSGVRPPVESPPEEPPLPEQPAELPPAVQPPPPKQLDWEEPASQWVAGNLTRLAREADRTVTDTSPPRNQNFTKSRLAADGSIRFTWAGAADEYRFALYRNDEMEIVPPVTVFEPSYTFTDAGILKEGTYVWHVYEKNRRGEWDLPSAVSTLYVLSKMPEN
jgi:hypothetical protein